MKVYKVELLIIDHDEIGEEGIKSALENSNYPSDCISPRVQGVESRDIGEWRDDHPLNLLAQRDEAYRRLFHGE
jgi:hypothetical protein